jgi:hypothetical protein
VTRGAVPVEDVAPARLLRIQPQFSIALAQLRVAVCVQNRRRCQDQDE